LTLTCCISCDSDWLPGIKSSINKTEVDSFSLLPHANVQGKMFLFSPGIDTVNCYQKDSCTCCRERIIFENDSEFISISYCEQNESYCKGKYVLYGPQVILNFNAVRVDYILQKDLIYKTEDKITVSERISPTNQWILAEFGCQSKKGLKTENENLFGFEDSIDKNEYLEQIKHKGILDKLKK
jgi:hypothetical protein